MTRRYAIILTTALLCGGAIVVWLIKTAPALVPEVAPPPAPEMPQVPVAEIPIATNTTEIIGTSVEGRPIEKYQFGTGSTSLLFVGGIHGGYEWNSSALAYEFISALSSNTITVPANVTVTIIPTLNPDGLFAATGLIGSFTATMVPPNDAHTTGRGRFNANDVDLNRNFACKWQPNSTWRNQPVSAGTAPFSEPEAETLRQLVATEPPAAVVFWHSQGGAVYGSACEGGILPQTLTLMNTYANAAGYESIPLFDAYPITGDAEGWLASIGIPAITVELATRTTTEWEKNREAFVAILAAYE